MVFTLLTAPAFAAQITGTLSLPSGPTAPPGGLRIFVQAKNLNGSEFASTNGLMAAGSNNLPYTLNIPDDPAASWRVSISCAHSITPGCLEYVEGGYFKSGISGSLAYKAEDATPLAGGAAGHNNIDMTLLDGHSVSGSITMPSGTGSAPAGGLDVKIYARQEPLGGYSMNHVFTIPENQNSVPFLLTVPDDPAMNFVVRYSCESSAECQSRYVSNGFYRSGVSGNTVESSVNAQQFIANTARLGLDMVFLTGASISGSISLPSGVAPAGGVSIHVIAIDTNGGSLNCVDKVVIPAGTNTIDYRLNCSNDNSASWRVHYFCNSLVTPAACADYFNLAYYSDTGTVAAAGDATPLAGGVGHSNINMTLFSTATISGRISLDSGALPAGGVEILVSAQNQDNVIATDVFTLTSPATFGNYTIGTPSDPASTWKISYVCRDVATGNPCKNFAFIGYFNVDSPGSTTQKSADADLLPGGVSHTNIDMILIYQPEESVMCFPIVARPGKIAVICI